jgi:integrase
MINRSNYLVVKDYLRYQREVMLRSDETVSRKWQRLHYLPMWSADRPLETAPGIRPVFPRWLDDEYHLADVGQRRICLDVRAFVAWLRRRWPRRYQALTGEWVDTLRPVRAMMRPRQERRVVTVEMVRQLLAIPPHTLAPQREQAAAAMLFLSGMRARAFVTLPIRAVDMERLMVLQYPEMGVETKGQKAIATSLLPIDDLLEVVRAWDAVVRRELAPEAMWWTVLHSHNGVIRLVSTAPGEHRDSLLRRRIAGLFRLAGLAPLSPHKFRHGHAVYALKRARTMADLKAVSQNLGHANIGITDGIYAVLDDADVAGRIAGLENARNDGDKIALLIQILEDKLL